MSRAPDAQLSHIGLYVRDLDAMVAFYTDLLGLVVTDRGVSSRGGRIAFLSRSAHEHHQLVLVDGRTGHESPVNQISFRVESLEGLRGYYVRLTERRVRIDRCMNHGNAWSVYCFDPEDNRLELYAVSPWYVSQPFARPLDLARSADEILAETEATARSDPSFMPLAEWSARMKEKLGLAPQ